MLRRDLLRASGLAVAAMLFPRFVAGAMAEPVRSENGEPFTDQTVIDLARELALNPFEPPERGDLPEGFADLGYDDYRGLRFDADRSLWVEEELPFRVSFLHRGFIFAERIDVFEVAGGQARRILYDPELFSLNGLEVPEGMDLGFSGVRLHTPLNRTDGFDEVAVFQGASYFRAVAAGQVYGLSARGLAIRTADPEGEEFPIFRAYWIERPETDADTLTIHALLDSESATAAFRFTLDPGAVTQMNVEMTLFPRRDLEKVGIAPLTSMFFFAANDRADVDDFRPAVHDSDGLEMWNGSDERLWRPLSNPERLQISAFMDGGTRGFGLMQRKARYEEYDDLEARYERRPSLWVEPSGDWGAGSVMLIEIPTSNEIHDNIVAFWRPGEPLSAGGEYPFAYRLYWGGAEPETDDAPPLARFRWTRAGAGQLDASRLFVLDAVGPSLVGLPDDAPVTPVISASAGRVETPSVYRNPETGGFRLSFQLLPEGAESIELRALLMLGEEPLTENWLYRWTV